MIQFLNSNSDNASIYYILVFMHLPGQGWLLHFRYRTFPWGSQVPPYFASESFVLLSYRFPPPQTSVHSPNSHSVQVQLTGKFKYNYIIHGVPRERVSILQNVLNQFSFIHVLNILCNYLMFKLYFFWTSIYTLMVR